MNVNQLLAAVPDGGARPVTDRGLHLADAHMLAQQTGGAGKWIAARLSNGKTDGAIYDTKADAIAHQLHETQCAYIQVLPFGFAMPPHEASAVLELNEHIYDSGRRIADPNGPTPVPTSAILPVLNRRMRRAAQRKGNR